MQTSQIKISYKFECEYTIGLIIANVSYILFKFADKI